MGEIEVSELGTMKTIAKSKTEGKKKCLILINDNAGKCRKCSVENVKKALGEYDFTAVHLPSKAKINFEEFDTFAVCGGDGTLQIIMQKIYNLDKTVYYFPCGTLNDKAGAEKYSHATLSPHPVTIGKVDENVFTYVFASGAFTEIGYTAKQKDKQRFGVLAYVLKVLKAYEVNRIKCKITCQVEDSLMKNEDNIKGKISRNTDSKSRRKSDKTEIDNLMTKEFQGEFNLIMFIKSPRCFGFHFNKLYDEQDDGGHLVMIPSPKHDGLIGKVEMFFPFFKVFFLGLRKESEDGVIFKRIKSAMVSLPHNTTFCVDGERRDHIGDLNLSFEKTTCKLKIIDII